jgi:hypothetical protein
MTDRPFRTVVCSFLFLALVPELAIGPLWVRCTLLCSLGLGCRVPQALSHWKWLDRGSEGSPRHGCNTNGKVAWDPELPASLIKVSRGEFHHC